MPVKSQRSAKVKSVRQPVVVEFQSRPPPTQGVADGRHVLTPPVGPSQQPVFPPDLDGVQVQEVAGAEAGGVAHHFLAARGRVDSFGLDAVEGEGR